MNINIHVYHYGGNDDKINDILSVVLDNQQKLIKMADELVNLETEIAENTTVVESVITLIDGLSQQIKDAGTDAVKLKAVTDTLDANNKRLADKVAENTVAADETPE